MRRKLVTTSTKKSSVKLSDTEYNGKEWRHAGTIQDIITMYDKIAEFLRTALFWVITQRVVVSYGPSVPSRGELSYLAPLYSENISAPYFKQCFFRGGWGIAPQTVKHHASQSQDRNNKYFILYRV